MSDPVVIWGEVLWDRFPDGDQLGGAPANVAWHLAQAGGWAQLVSRVGDDEAGRRALDRLGEQVDVELVQVDPEYATGEVTVEVVAGEPRYTLHAGRAWERIACTDAVRAALATAGVLVYGTLAQHTPAGLRGWREAIAATRGTRVCDLNLRPGQTHSIAITEALAEADVIKLNERELAALRAWLACDDPVGALLRGKTKIVALTRGAAGSTLYGDHAPLEIPGFPSSPGGDNVGCGDAYLAILVYGLTSGWDLATSGRAASRYAAAVAGARGATPRFDDARVAELLEVP